LDWLAKAFGLETRVLVTGPDGEIVHSEMEFGEGVVMIGGTAGYGDRKSPRALAGVNTQSVQLFVDDVEAHCARARSAGATIERPPESKEYGDRSYGALDCEGHLWWFTQRVDEDAWQKSIAPYRVTQAK
ncbi:MAG: VOC family protein, partial [Solirubrobacteraceae bacterium]